MPRERLIDAVLLDLDGTLHDTEIHYVEALRHAMAALGHAVDDRFCHGLIGLPREAIREAIRQSHGADFPLEALERGYRAALVQAFAAGVRVKPGAASLVRRLRDASIPVAVATAASREGATTNLESSRLGAMLPVVVTRDDVARGKPFPDLFLEAARRLGVPPARCLAVEDSANGVRAAHAAGTITIMVPDIVPPTPAIRALCRAVLPDLDAVAAVVFREDGLERLAARDGAETPLRP